MKEDERILQEVKVERERDDKVFKEVHFELRNDNVTMFFDYYEPSPNEGDHHFVRHNHDPEFLDIETYERVKKGLLKEGIHFTERRDEFM